MPGLLRCIGVVTLAAAVAAHPAARSVAPSAQTPAAKQTAVWPTEKWPVATPESQGLSAEALDGVDKQVREGTYGNVDWIFVTRNGHAVMNQRYARDYRAISRDRTGPLGCGEGCTDKSWMHEFNYFHPNWHPYYQGRDVHTLQSVTKSIAATVDRHRARPRRGRPARRAVPEVLQGSRPLACRSATS